MEITEAKIKYKWGRVERIEVLIPDGDSYKAYAAETKIVSGYYYINKNINANVSQEMINNTAKAGFKISAVHYFPNYFRD